MPVLSLTEFNIACATLGGFISIFGLVSFLFKEHFYLSEAFISTLFGVVFSPHAANFIRPLAYAQGSEDNLEIITLYFTRLVLGVQLVIAGIQLPSRYLRTEWKSLSLMIGPGMVGMWILSALIVWLMVPHLTFLHALAVASCITPTDPILSNSIVKGKFADKHIPGPLQKLIIAESGTNDGLGYPFLFIALYLIKFDGREGFQGAGWAMEQWFVETWFYTIFLSVAYGAFVGWLAKVLLRYCEKKGYVDRESFLVFAIALALFVLGTDGMVGSDDVLACFIAGNTFTWDDWFRKETEDDSLQPTIDLLLNISVFLWFGAVCPWSSFLHNDVIPLWRLVILGILIMLFRRLPVVFALHKGIHQIQHWRQMAFVGFFGPIGVSAIFYLYVSTEFLKQITVNGEQREDAARLQEVFTVVIWFSCITSIFVHGLSVPLGKLGYNLPRTMSQAISREKDDTDPSRLSFMRSLFERARSALRRPNSENQITAQSSVPRSADQAAVDVEKCDKVMMKTTSALSTEPSRPIVFIDSPQGPSRIGTPKSSTHQLPLNNASLRSSTAPQPRTITILQDQNVS